MPQITITITDEQAQAVQQLVATGVFLDSNDVLCRALEELDLRYRLDHADAATIQHLRDLIQEGIDSGPAEPLDLDAFLLELKEHTGTFRKLA